MLPTHHRPDVYEDHISEFDPKAVCHYPLDILSPIPLIEPTTERRPRDGQQEENPEPASLGQS
jgi:hypothetical protein